MTITSSLGPDGYEVSIPPPASEDIDPTKLNEALADSDVVVPAKAKTLVNVGIGLNAGWHRLGVISGVAGDTVHIRVQGAIGYVAGAGAHAETIILARRENDGAWRATWWAFGSQAASAPSDVVIGSGGVVIIKALHYCNFDVAYSGSGSFTVDYAFLGTSQPAGIEATKAVAIKVGGSNALVVAADYSVTLFGPLRNVSATLASLNARPGNADGMIAYANNARKIGEGSGAGTGCVVYYSSGTWRRVSDDTAAAT